MLVQDTPNGINEVNPDPTNDHFKSPGKSPG